MAPQRESAELCESGPTFYGALELKDEAKTSSRRPLILASVGLAAACMTIAAFTVYAPAGAAPASTVNQLQVGDDLEDREDCLCQDGVACAHIEGQYFGQCIITDQTDPDCMGFDYADTYQVGSDWYSHCQYVQGQYDCYRFPCMNGGFCVDGSDGYTCVCPFGYEGKDCDLEIDECSEQDEPVCHNFATCSNAEGSYACTCNPGFFGDGYAVNQDGVKWGSVLVDDSNYGWLDRGNAADYSDNNQDGTIDRYGCTDVNDCASNPCFNGGRCVDLWDGHYDSPGDDYTVVAASAQAASNAFECDCTVALPGERWSGDYCENDVDECSSALHNCDNMDRANCANTDGSFTCTCRQFWQGDGYSPNSNTTDWDCTEAGGCLWHAGYEGCEDIDDCVIRTFSDADSFTESSPCQNGATCTNDGLGTGEYRCFCVIGWRGHDCEIDINECEENAPEDLSCDANAYCSNTPGSWTCLCNNGWTGEGNVEGGCYDADDCEFSPCQHGGTCTDCGTLCYLCDCIIGWRGKSCEIDWNECTMGIHTCNEFAWCVNVPGSFECECEPGYSGDGYNMCNEVNDCLYYIDDPAIDDNTLVDYAIKEYNADGSIARQMKPIENAKWLDDLPQVIDGVTRHQCGVFGPSPGGDGLFFTPHGTCEDVGPASYVCTCEDGWTDSNCDRDVDECARNIDTCAKWSDCTNTDGSFTCACKNGFIGDGSVGCNDQDDCAIVGGDRCDKGFCTDLGVGDFRCTCDSGWTDRLCNMDINECTAQTHACYVNSEQCTVTKKSTKQTVGAGGAIITVEVQVKVPAWVDDAETIPKMCKLDYKNAECINTPGSYRCQCRAGFVGDGIGDEGCDDIDECGSAPCENAGGEVDAYGRATGCQDDGPQAYNCVCNAGWTDTNCDMDVNECIMGSHDCHPDAKCVNAPGAYYCRCISGYTGDGYTCTDLDDCDPDPCCTEHASCVDLGANNYGCVVEEGFTGPDGCSQVDECTEGTHNCDPNADCTDNYGSYMCTCDKEFAGDGIVCAPCTVCRGFCPPVDASLAAHEVASLATCGSDAWTATGWVEDSDSPPCDAVDRTCINVNECGRLNSEMQDNCDDNAGCDDTEGSFTCGCNREYFGAGTEGECAECTNCALGESLFTDCTSADDRQCTVIVPNGNYALQTMAGSVEQCLVHWKEPGKIYPSRYAWGGRATTATEGADELGDASATQSYGSNWRAGVLGAADAPRPGPDYCDNPICGICDWNGKTAADNLVIGMEAVWTFRRLHDDLYLILNAADGHGFRCLGFQKPEAPYPTLIAWKDTNMDAAEGVCNATETVCSSNNDCQPQKLTVSAAFTATVGMEVVQTKTIPGFGNNPDQTVRSIGFVSAGSAGTAVTVTISNGEFDTTASKGAVTIDGTGVTVSGVGWLYEDVNSECVKEMLIVGEWRTDQDGVDADDLERCEVNGAGLPTNCRLDYFCGHQTDSNGAAFDKMMSNGGTIWNVHKLGCEADGERRWLCERNPRYENQFLVRSLAGQDANLDNSITKMDYECLYFPQIGGGEYTHPRRTPRAPTDDGVWGGLAADADGNADNECGMMLMADGESQEDRLVLNKQATWSLVPLPSF